MKMKRVLALVLAFAVAGGLMYLSWDYKLKASEEDGSTTAAEQQAGAVEESQPVEVVVPAKEEEALPEPSPAAEKPAVAAEETVAESTAEPTAEPTEEPTAAPTAAPTIEATEEPATANITVEVRMESKGDLYYGDTVELVAEVSGAEGIAYTIVWEYDDGKGWQSIGETGPSYQFVLDEINALYNYRAVAVTE